MGRERHPSIGGESSRRTKARHDPNPPRYVEESEEEDNDESEEIEEQPQRRRSRRRSGKEPATDEYAPHPQQAPHQVPYMMRSMLVPRAIARPNPRARGAAYAIFPWTPDCLVAEFGHG